MTGTEEATRSSILLRGLNLGRHLQLHRLECLQKDRRAGDDEGCVCVCSKVSISRTLSGLESAWGWGWGCAGGAGTVSLLRGALWASIP